LAGIFQDDPFAEEMQEEIAAYRREVEHTMNMIVVIEPVTEGGYRAMLPGWPDITAQAATEAAALDRVRQMLQARLAQAKVVPLALETTPETHPWLRLAGIFQDNPLVDEVEAEIAAYRHEVDTAEDPQS
jgi:predicted RNase H-like HicB family nuclease